MNPYLHLRMMVIALLQAKLRSFSAIGAIGLGIASLTIMLALTAGARAEMQAIADQMGKNLLMIKAGEVLSKPGRGNGWYVSRKLDATDVEDLRRNVRGLNAVVPILENSVQVKFEDQDLVTSVRGVTAEYLELRNFRIANGRALEAADSEHGNRVALLGSFAAQKLGAGSDLVGSVITIAGIPFEVVGELEPKGISSDGSNEDDQILVPIGTASRRLYNVEYLSRILVRMEEPGMFDAVRGPISTVLRENHDLDPGAPDDFEIFDMVGSNRIRSMNSSFINGLAQIFAVTTLLIACVGVSAVTYLNIKARIGEIGLRKALGATARDILLLFVAESSLLSIVGGVAGLLVGLGGSAILGRWTGWQTAIDGAGVLLPFATSVVIGFAFSLVPAMRAATLTPVRALRAV